MKEDHFLAASLLYVLLSVFLELGKEETRITLLVDDPVHHVSYAEVLVLIICHQKLFFTNIVNKGDVSD